MHTDNDPDTTTNPDDFSLKLTLRQTLHVCCFKQILPTVFLLSGISVLFYLFDTRLPLVILFLGSIVVTVSTARYFLLQEPLLLFRFQQHEGRYLAWNIPILFMGGIAASPLIALYLGNTMPLVSLLGFLSFVSLAWIFPTVSCFLIFIACTPDYKKAFDMAKKITFPINLSLIGGILFIHSILFFLSLPFLSLLNFIHPVCMVFGNGIIELFHAMIATTFLCVVIARRLEKSLTLG